MKRALIMTLLALVGPGSALAGGIEVPTNGTVALGRGGAFTALADDLVLLEYNPGALIKLRGTQLYFGNNIINYDLSFAGLDAGGQSVEPVTNGSGPMYLAPFVAASTDFGLENWRFALGVFGPSANGILELPEDPKGSDPRRPHHYLIQEMEVLLAFYTLSASYGVADHWGVGLALHWADLMQADITMWVNAYDPGLPDSPFFREDNMDVRAAMHAADRFNFAATLGGWYRPVSFIELGASLRFPNINFKATGESQLLFEDGLLQDFYAGGLENGGTDGLVAFDSDGKPTGAGIPTTMEFSFPMVARLGARYVHRTPTVAGGERELFDVEADLVWEGWSVLESYAVTLKDHMKMTGSGFKPEEGGKSSFSFQQITVPRGYEDTWSVRVGGQYAPLEWLTLRSGAYLESGAVPRHYTNVDFASFDRLGVGGGLSLSRWGMKLSLAWLHVFQATRQLSAEESEVYTSFALWPDPPTDSQYVVGAGTFETGYDIFSAALSAAF